MVRLEWDGATAIPAPSAIRGNESEPLLTRERATRSRSARAIALLFRATNLGMRREIARLQRVDLTTTTQIRRALVLAIALSAELGIPLTPLPHGLARSFRITFQPLKRIPALILRFLVCHALYLADRRRRVNRTRHEKAGHHARTSLLRGKDSNLRPSGYEPDELPLLHPAM